MERRGRLIPVILHEPDDEYAQKRIAEYPTLDECIHAILDDDLVALQEKRAAVKAKYPKAVS
tara:strand:+ start:893 stop:1078 length:186 start_codon:yes stop_codon:yes gene_type:complete